MSVTTKESPQTAKIEKTFQRVTQALAGVQQACNLGAWNEDNGEVLQARYARADSLLQATQVMLNVDPDDPSIRSQETLIDLLTKAVSAFGLTVVPQSDDAPTPLLPALSAKNG